MHLPLLTVRETLAFARDALWAAGAKNDLAPEFHQVLDAEASEVGSTVLVSCRSCCHVERQCAHACGASVLSPPSVTK